jgi:hypothetical protein
MLNQLFHLGHASDVDGWLAVAEMPAHFRPEHLGRAAARFDESQLTHWQKETLARMSTAEIGAWLGLGDNADLIELVRHNVVLPADAAPWMAAVRGELPPLGEASGASSRRGTRIFRRRGSAARRGGTDLKQLTKLAQGTHRAQGRGPVHAAARRADRPAARSGTRTLLRLMPPDDRAPALRIACSKSIIP